MNLTSELENYLSKHTTEESSVLKELRERIHTLSGAGMEVGHVEGKFLALMVKISGAKKILEIGTYAGYSALSMAEALPDDGRLLTIDYNNETADVAHHFWNQSSHGYKIGQKIGPALEIIPHIQDTFDFIFIDADKRNYKQYWELCMERLKIGGLIIVDNTLWEGAVLDPQDTTTKAIHDFNDFIMHDTRVEIVIVPIRDGITIGRKI